MVLYTPAADTLYSTAAVYHQHSGLADPALSSPPLLGVSVPWLLSPFSPHNNVSLNSHQP
jgi:hypothetical protein